MAKSELGLTVHIRSTDTSAYGNEKWRNVILGSKVTVTGTLLGGDICTDTISINSWKPVAPVDADPERVAQLTAHRVCCGTEHDPSNGRLHGYCVICGVPWPCDYAGPAPIPVTQSQPLAVAEKGVVEAIEEFLSEVFDEVEQRKDGGNDESWTGLQQKALAAKAALAKIIPLQDPDKPVFFTQMLDGRIKIQHRDQKLCLYLDEIPGFASALLKNKGPCESGEDI